MYTLLWDIDYTHKKYKYYLHIKIIEGEFQPRINKMPIRGLHMEGSLQTHEGLSLLPNAIQATAIFSGDYATVF